MSTSDKNWCFAWFAKSRSVGAERAALITGAKWPKGSTIEISFLDGSDALRETVRRHAAAWLEDKTVRLRFAFRKDTTNTPIRISFANAGSWSTIGTTCRQVPAAKPTMNFGWLDGASEAEANGVILHEFGHAIGLIHEHQSPDEAIKWNKDAVYHDLAGPPNNWSKDVIDFNMFTPYSKKETNFTKLDPQSIMMYPLPSSWTLDGFSVGVNSSLSPTDKRFVRAQYSGN